MREHSDFIDVHAVQLLLKRPSFLHSKVDRGRLTLLSFQEAAPGSENGPGLCSTPGSGRSLSLMSARRLWLAG